MKNVYRSESGRPSENYDFDEWVNQHYGDSFKRSQKNKKRYEDVKYKQVETPQHVAKELAMLTIFFSFLALTILYEVMKPKYDVDKTKEKKS